MKYIHEFSERREVMWICDDDYNAQVTWDKTSGHDWRKDLDWGSPNSVTTPNFKHSIFNVKKDGWTKIEVTKEFFDGLIFLDKL